MLPLPKKASVVFLIITCCGLEGLTVKKFAEPCGLSVIGSKLK